VRTFPDGYTFVPLVPSHLPRWRTLLPFTIAPPHTPAAWRAHRAATCIAPLVLARFATCDITSPPFAHHTYRRAARLYRRWHANHRLFPLNIYHSTAYPYQVGAFILSKLCHRYQRVIPLLVLAQPLRTYCLRVT